MTTTLPTPSHGLEYTNSETGDNFKYDSDAGAWEGFEGIDESGDSMTGTIAYPDMLINGNTLTVGDPTGSGGSVEIKKLQWEGYPASNEKPTWRSVCFSPDNGGVFVSVGNGANENVKKTMRSVTGGREWNGIASFNDAWDWVDVAWGNYNPDPFGNPIPGKVVCVSISGKKRVMHSDDQGRSWSVVGSGGGVEQKSWSVVEFGQGKFLSFADGEDTSMVSGDGGTTWTEIPVDLKGTSIQDICYSDRLSRWLAVGIPIDPSGPTVILSSDAVNWSQYVWNKDLRPTSCVYGDNGFVVTCSNPSDSSEVIMHSPDGINFSPVDMSNCETSIHAKWSSVTYGEGIYVAVASENNNNLCEVTCIWSKDGITWYFADEDNWEIGNSWSSVAYGNERFVAVATTGTDKTMVALTSSLSSGGPTSKNSSLLFNGNSVVVQAGQFQRSLRKSNSLINQLGSTRYYQSYEPSEAFGIDNGTLWLNPSNAKLSIYHDSDWNQLN